MPTKLICSSIFLPHYNCQTMTRPLFPTSDQDSDQDKTFSFKEHGAEFFLNVSLAQMPFEFQSSTHLCCFKYSFLWRKKIIKMHLSTPIPSSHHPHTIAFDSVFIFLCCCCSPSHLPCVILLKTNTMNMFYCKPNPTWATSLLVTKQTYPFVKLLQRAAGKTIKLSNEILESIPSHNNAGRATLLSTRKKSYNI